ncbi:DNA-binding response regulator [Rhodopila globiformis]|uniref:Regulatory protein VirG n=2 Tax=Rhodopila globiformis TaxID=1071 RepID=A0A2S6N8I9_RHOGL|nr:response regulator [Rhodopila globiformis]PPQ30928.1 DNA-binding response regulator [Rhodopila globiformis]
METLSRIAVVEDDPEISRMMVSFMTDHGFDVSAARSGRDLDKVMSGGKIDCVILDVGLPGEDGLSICKRLRGKSSVPIIMVTARGTETDRIVGLELGADDYLPKPFSPRELVARVKAVIRRAGAQEQATAPAQPQVLMFEGWKLDMARRQLFDPAGAPRSLTSGEFNVLALFCTHPRKVLSRDDLLELLHGRAAAVFDRSIDVQISRLRRKIETNLKDPTFIKTIRYGGYFFTPEVTAVTEG